MCSISNRFLSEPFAVSYHELVVQPHPFLLIHTVGPALPDGSMVLKSACGWFLLAAYGSAMGAANNVTPVEQAMELVKKLRAQLEATTEGKKDAEQYDKST